MVTSPHNGVSEGQDELAARGRTGVVAAVRAIPIRWRILSIAALNSAVVLVLAGLIWSGSRVLSSAWDDVRQVRQSDQVLALLESETGRLQNLIHRYINQPSPELFAEILLLREAVLGTLNTRASTDPMLSGSVAELERVTGLRRVHNFYGMAEQIGTVFVECERGFLHAPNGSDIVVRNPATWEVVTDGEIGVAQMLSALPESYPGHSILTEDFARVEAVDSCPCGRCGKAVSILGRIPEAEMRGCSDTHAHNGEAAA